MKEDIFKNYTFIFWDFDGVIMDSNEVRDIGFKKVFQEYPKEQVALLMKFHRKNGGLSRYVKFRYFFEEVRKRKITDEEINKWADKFSEIMLDLLIKPDLLIDETIDYIKKNYKKKTMHIVSGSDQEELRHICKSLEIDHYFESINGSPTPKNELVKNILESQSYDTDNCVLIGDSINDFEAAKSNRINFIAYNNEQLKNKISK